MIDTHADSDLLAGVNLSSKDNGTLIREVFHGSLFNDDITVRHRARTGNTHEVRGVLNHVVTAYVEHAFLAWLLSNVYHIKPPKMPETANCQSDEVDPEVFFPDDDVVAEVDDFLAAKFGDDEPETPEILARRQRYLTLLESEDVRKSKAKAVCEDCPFSLECLTRSVLNNDEFGVWGGIDEKERHLMINRFERMRQEYNNGSMPKGMRSDLEGQARQIAGAISRAVKAERQAAA